MIYKPTCQQPLLLFNKFVFSMLQSGGTIYYFGKPIKVSHIAQIPVKTWLDSARHMSDEDIESCYCVDGEVKEPLFLYVPCMQCTLCRHSRQVDLINRSILETLTWDTPPVFFTLTYREQDLPCVKVGKKRYEVGELRYKDIQDFFKRLRRRWDRKGIKHDIRYLVAGEYGKRGRCHWHVIMWNNPYGADEFNPLLFNQLHDDVFHSWSHSEPQAFDFGQCKGGAAPYATKYVTKPSATHGHHVKPMIRTSSGKRGGLGSIFLSSVIPYLRENPSINYLDYVDKKGNYNYMYYSKSISRKVWPSLSMTVPNRVRQDYKQLVDCLTILSQTDCQSDLSEIACILRPQYVTNNFKPMPKHPCWLQRVYICKLVQPVVNELIESLSVVNNIDIEYRKSLYIRKSMFISTPQIATGQKVSKYAQQEAVALSRQIL